MNKKILKNKKGFTLIELIVVMAVLALLAVMAVPRLIGYTKDASVTAMKADAKVLENVSLIYNIENEAWPVLEAVTPGTFAALEAAVPSVEFYNIDFAGIENQIKTLKNPITEYVLDVDGNVYHTEGVIDKDGDTHYSIDIEVLKEAPAQG